MGGQTAHTVTRAGPRLALFFFWREALVLNVTRMRCERERKKNSTCSFCTLPEKKKRNREAHIRRTVMYGWVFPRSFHSRRSNHNAGRHCFTSPSAQTYLSQKVPSPRSCSAHFQPVSSSSLSAFHVKKQAQILQFSDPGVEGVPILLTVGDFQVFLCVWSTS